MQSGVPVTVVDLDNAASSGFPCAVSGQSDCLRHDHCLVQEVARVALEEVKQTSAAIESSYRKVNEAERIRSLR